MAQRQVVLDTETTGLEPSLGHRIIEIGCVELVSRRLTGNNYHQYINPQREIDQGAVEVHGITNEFLADKPNFAGVAESFFDYIRGAELIIHNAPFDIGFINSEFRRQRGEDDFSTADHCAVVDTLVMARNLHPGQRNSLDALCKRYQVDNSQRDLHGALLDAEILADVYLAMTGGQTSLGLGSDSAAGSGEVAGGRRRQLDPNRSPLPIIAASAEELQRHAERLQVLEKKSGQRLWEAPS